MNVLRLSVPFLSIPKINLCKRSIKTQTFVVCNDCLFSVHLPYQIRVLQTHTTVFVPCNRLTSIRGLLKMCCMYRLSINTERKHNIAE